MRGRRFGVPSAPVMLRHDPVDQAKTMIDAALPYRLICRDARRGFHQR